MTDQQKSQRGANLTQADRERGGKVSAAKQERDARGKFAGTKKRSGEGHTQAERRDQEHQNQSGQSPHQP